MKKAKSADNLRSRVSHGSTRMKHGIRDEPTITSGVLLRGDFGALNRRQRRKQSRARRMHGICPPLSHSSPFAPFPPVPNPGCSVIQAKADVIFAHSFKPCPAVLIRDYCLRPWRIPLAGPSADPPREASGLCRIFTCQRTSARTWSRVRGQIITYALEGSCR